jgi:hypothetical protein
MIAPSLVAFLKADAGVAGYALESIFPDVCPQGVVYPAITYSLDEDGRDQLLDEIGGLKQALVSIDCYDPEHERAHLVAEAVETALAGYRGAFGTVTADHVRLERKFGLFETDAKLYRVSQQFLVAYY